MIIYIDHLSTQSARVINLSREHDDERTYYLIARPGRPDALIVCRHSLKLDNLAGYVVDASVGWDTAMPGFAREEEIGRQRTKVTIRRLLPHQRTARSLSDLIQAKPKQTDP